MGLEKRTYTDQETVITAENMNAIQDSVIALEDGVFMRAASGAPVVIADSSNNKLLGLSVYGKSTQASVPTPAAPVNIDSVGDDGAIKCGLFGKNIFDASKLGLHKNTSLTVLDDGYTIIATGGKGVTYASSRCELPLSLKGQSLYLAVDSIEKIQDAGVSAQVTVTTPSGTYYHTVAMQRNGISFIVPSDATSISMGVYTNNTSKALESDNTVTVKGLRLMVAANKADGWTKAVSEQSITLSHTLRGVPVTDKSYATYTDASGQMWCADEIDLARGVHIQRVKVLEFAVADMDNLDAYPGWKGLTELLECFPVGTNGYYTYTSNMGTSQSVNTSNANYVLYLRSEVYGMTQTQWKENYPNLVCKFMFPLITPVETALTSAEIAAYKALHTNKPNTIAFNDENAYMSVKYVADAKAYIDHRLSNSSVKASVALPASAWVGSGNIYSQVVKIDGVTKNSQVNLTPNISQMATFYEKDITFITENDGGVVTVYVIGQKPANDYTIQASIVEVNV